MFVICSLFPDLHIRHNDIKHYQTRVEKLCFRLPILMLVLQLFTRSSLMLVAPSYSKYRRGQNGRNASCGICRVFLCVI